MQPGQVAHLLLRPHLDHLARVALGVALEPRVTRHIPVITSPIPLAAIDWHGSQGNGKLLPPRSSGSRMPEEVLKLGRQLGSTTSSANDYIDIWLGHILRVSNLQSLLTRMEDLWILMARYILNFGSHWTPVPNQDSGVRRDFLKWGFFAYEISLRMQSWEPGGRTCHGL